MSVRENESKRERERMKVRGRERMKAREREKRDFQLSSFSSFNTEG